MAKVAVLHHEKRVNEVVSGDVGTTKEIPEPTIIYSWKRCLNDYGLSPADSPASSVLEACVLKEQRERLGDMFEIAQDECRNLYEQTPNSGYAIVLTDANGVVLDYVCDPNLRDTFKCMGLLPGALWSEQHEGTNGMGTCLQEGRSVIVHRDDHFFNDLIGMTCTSTPVRDPYGHIQAALDVSSFYSKDSKQSQFHTKALVQMAAGFIEYRHFLRLFQDSVVLRFHSRPEFLGIGTEAMLAMNTGGQILAANDSALRQLCYTEREQLVGRYIDEVFSIAREFLEGKNDHLFRTVWPVHDIRHGHRYLALLHAPEKKGRQGTASSAPRVSVSVSPRQGSLCLDLKGLAGSDPHMAYNIRCARRVMNKDVPILVIGETGTGKEAFAKAIHEASERSDRPFVALNCAAIPESLIESELFGYKHGAFTGARREGSQGSIMQSNGGTLFLDEIGDMPLHLQTRLLRVLEAKEVVPLGGQTPMPVDLHVISATNRELQELMQNGDFREDLYYRLNGLTLTLPALRARRDIDALIRCALAAENSTQHRVSIEKTAFKQLHKYHWPGNLRELRNVIRTALALSDDGMIRLADLPKELVDLSPAKFFQQEQVRPSAPDSDSTVLDLTPLESAERETLLAELERNHWNVTLTAVKLKMSRSTLYRKLKKYGIPITPPANEG